VAKGPPPAPIGTVGVGYEDVVEDVVEDVFAGVVDVEGRVLLVDVMGVVFEVVLAVVVELLAEDVVLLNITLAGCGRAVTKSRREERRRVAKAS